MVVSHCHFVCASVCCTKIQDPAQTFLQRRITGSRRLADGGCDIHYLRTRLDLEPAPPASRPEYTVHNSILVPSGTDTPQSPTPLQDASTDRLIKPSATCKPYHMCNQTSGTSCHFCLSITSGQDVQAWKCGVQFINHRQALVSSFRSLSSFALFSSWSCWSSVIIIKGMKKKWVKEVTLLHFSKQLPSLHACMISLYSLF